MLNKIITQAQKYLQESFDPEGVEKTGRTTQFVKRQSKLTGFVFLKTLVMGFLSYPHATLKQLAGVCADMNVEITAQGLDDRLSQAAVDFLKQRLVEALSHWRVRSRGVGEIMQHFTEVYLMDSTSVALPATLQGLFPGSGGNASTAMLKIQLLFGLLSGALHKLDLVAGNLPDSGYQEHIPHLLPGSLLIQDLGYFNLDLFHTLADRAIFFLTRWRQDVKVYLNSDPQHALDMLTFLADQHSTVAAYQVQVGQQMHLSCRMVVVRLPQEVAEQRRRRVKADAQRRGSTVKPYSLALCDWNIFLTNIPSERLSLAQILACYGLRWQIELVFKLWKSQAGLNRLATLRKERALCEVYAKLIGIVLTHFLVAPLRFLLIEQRVQISPVIARQILQDRAKTISSCLGLPDNSLFLPISDLIHRILRFARINKRNLHLSSWERFCRANDLSLAQLYPLA